MNNIQKMDVDFNNESSLLQPPRVLQPSRVLQPPQPHQLSQEPLSRFLHKLQRRSNHLNERLEHLKAKMGRRAQNKKTTFIPHRRRIEQIPDSNQRIPISEYWLMKARKYQLKAQLAQMSLSTKSIAVEKFFGLNSETECAEQLLNDFIKKNKK